MHILNFSQFKVVGAAMVWQSDYVSSLHEASDLFHLNYFWTFQDKQMSYNLCEIIILNASYYIKTMKCHKGCSIVLK